MPKHATIFMQKARQTIKYLPSFSNTHWSAGFIESFKFSSCWINLLIHLPSKIQNLPEEKHIVPLMK